MKNKIIAQRYAEAFLSYARLNFGFEKAINELKDLKILFYENPELPKFLENMEILFAEKCEVIDKVLKDFSEETRQFLKLLLDKGRIKNIIDICDYVRLNYAHQEALDALVKTSYPLELKLIESIKKHFEQKIKRKLSLHIELDADLLGGVEVIIGNKVFDGSVKKKLDDLREKLMSVRVN